jgi:hypothetical protein
MTITARSPTLRNNRLQISATSGENKSWDVTTRARLHCATTLMGCRQGIFCLLLLAHWKVAVPEKWVDF